MGRHSQGDSHRLCRWRDIVSNTRGRISHLAVPLATALRKRIQLHTAEMRSRQEVAIAAGRTISLPFTCSCHGQSTASGDSVLPCMMQTTAAHGWRKLVDGEAGIALYQLTKHAVFYHLLRLRTSLRCERLILGFNHGFRTA